MAKQLVRRNNKSSGKNSASLNKVSKQNTVFGRAKRKISSNIYDLKPKQILAHSQETATKTTEKNKSQNTNNGAKYLADKHADFIKINQTRKLAKAIAQQLGIDSTNLDLRINDQAARVTGKMGAQGLMSQGVIYLHPAFFNPDSTRGRYLLGHEMAHLAQLKRLRYRDGSDKGLFNAEKEAHRIALKIADKEIPDQALLLINEWDKAADTGARTAGTTSTPASATTEQPAGDQGSDLDLQAIAESHYAHDIRRIQILLRGVWGFLWVTDGMVQEIMLILQGTQSFVVRRAIINALTEDEKRTLIDNISSEHSQRFRAEVLASYAAMPPEILRRRNHDIFDGMDFARLSEEELFALFYVKRYLPAREWQRMREQGGPARQHHLTEIERIGRSTLTEQALRQQEQEAAQNIQQHAKESAQASSAVTQDPVLTRILHNIRVTLQRGASEQEKLDILDQLLPYMGQPQKIRGVAEALMPPNPDLLTRLLEGFPAQHLYQGSQTEDNHSDTRLAVFLRLAGFRPPHQNVLLAQRLLRETHFLFIPFNSVSREEAFIAYQLIRVLPDDIRDSFLATDNGLYANRMHGAMSQEMRESASLNFYRGGEEGLDLASIQGQIMQDDLWQGQTIDRLYGLMRMVIAAGHHRWLFNQSRTRYQTDRNDYTLTVFLNRIVEPFLLYNPDAVDSNNRPVPRTEFRPEYLEELRTRGMVSFLFNSGDGWRLAGSALFGQSIVGRGINAVTFQEAMGGSFMGIRFTQHEQLGQQGSDARERGEGVNFIDYLRWDTRRGVLEMRANALDIAALRYRTGSILVQAGHGVISGLELNMAYPVPDADIRQAPSLDLRMSALTFENMLIASSGSMIAINRLELNGLEVDVGSDAIDNRHAQGETGFDFSSLSIITPILRLIGLATGELTERGAQISRGLLEARDPTPIMVNLRGLVLHGITLSGGQYIERIDIENFQLGVSGTREHYLQALYRSYSNLTHRIANLQVRQARSDTSEQDRRQITQDIARLNRQRETMLSLRRRINSAQNELTRLRERRSSRPESISPSDLGRINELSQFLSTFDHGGITLNAGRVRIRGLTGAAQLGELDLRNLHGHGTTSEGIAGLIPGSDTLLRIVRGQGFHPPTVEGRRPRERADFELDLGDINIRDFRLRGSIPTLESAETARDSLQNELARRPWDPRLRTALERANTRLSHTETYHQLAAIGVSYLNSRQLEAFNAARQYLSNEESLRIESFRAQGAALTFGRNGQQIGLHADQLDVSSIRVGENLTPLGTGAVTIREVHGRDIDMGLGFIGGLIDPSNGSTILSRLASVGVSGEHLRISGIDQFLPGIESGAPVTSIGEIRLENRFNLTADTRRGVIDAQAGEISIDRLRVQISEQSLQAEIAQISARSADQRSASQNARLQHLQTLLETLRGFEQALIRLHHDIEQETNTRRLAELRQMQQHLINGYDQWQVQLGSRSINVQGLSARLSGLGNISSEDFSFERVLRGDGITIEGTGRSTTEDDTRGQRRGDRIFHSMEIQDGRFPGGAVSRVTVGETHGSVRYSRSEIRLNNFSLENISVTDFFLMAGGHQIWSQGTTTLNGISVDASIRFAPNPDSPEDYMLSEVELRSFRINQLIADNLGYWSPSHNAQVDISSGTIGGISAENIHVQMPTSPDGDIQIRGQAGIESISDARFTAYVRNAVQFAHGTLNGSNLSIDFLESGNRRMTLGELSLTNGYIRTSSGFIRITARRLRGEIVQTSTGFEFNNIRLDRLVLSRFAWRSNGREFRGNRPTTIHNIVVNATVNTEQQGNPRISLRHIHFGRVVSEHFYYKQGALEITIQQPPTPAGTTSGTDAAQSGGAAASRSPLEVVDVDLRNLDWSPRGGLRPSAGHQEATVNVESIHAAMRVMREELDLNATLDTGSLSLRFLRDGRRILNIQDINATARGQAMDGLQIDVGIVGANSGDVTLNGNQLDMPNLQIPTININNMQFSNTDMEIRMPNGVGDATLTGTTANVSVELAPAESPLPFSRIIVRSLHVPRAESRGAKVTLRNMVPIGGSRRDLIISTSQSDPTVITNIRLRPLAQGGEGFVITPRVRAGTTDEIEFLTSGRLALGSLATNTAALEIQRFMNASANIEIQEINVGFFSSGGRTVNIGQIDLTEVFGTVAGEHHFNAGLYQPGRHPQADGSEAPHTSPLRGPRITISGFERGQDGSISVNSISAHGLVYENRRLGLRMQILDAVVPQNGAQPGLVYNASTGTVNLHQATITNAEFTLNDLNALTSGSSGGSSSLLNYWELPDALNGVISFNVIGQQPYIPNVHRTLHVNDGRLSFRELEGIFGMVVNFELEGNRLVLNLNWGRILAGKAGPPSVLPSLPLQGIPDDILPDAELYGWEGLDRSERRDAGRGQARISTLIRRRPASSGGGSFDLSQYINVRDIDVALWLRGSPTVYIGANGQLRIEGRNDPGHIDIQASGNIPGTLRTSLHNLTASIVSGHPLVFNGISVNSGSLELEQLRDLDIDFTGFTPGRTTGTITRATVNNLELQLPKSSSGGGSTP